MESSKVRLPAVRDADHVGKWAGLCQAGQPIAARNAHPERLRQGRPTLEGWLACRALTWANVVRGGLAGHVSGTGGGGVVAGAAGRGWRR